MAGQNPPPGSLDKDTDIPLQGTVVTLKRGDNYGFIKPSDQLPDGFIQKDIFFLLNSVQGNDVDEGDNVEFLLREWKKERPEARKVWLTTLQNGTQDEKHPVQKVNRGPKTQAVGKICKVGNGNGKIEVIGDIPEAFLGFRDIYFDCSWVQSGEMDLCNGDTVSFNISLSTRCNNELTAHQIRLVECRPRSPAAIHEHILKVIEKVESASDADNDVLLRILRCDAVWRVIGRCWAMETETILRLLYLIERLKEKSKAFPQNFTQMLETFVNTDFCNTQRSCFKLYIEKAWTAQQESRQNQIKRFLLMILDLLPGKARVVAALVKSMIPPGTESTEHFLYMIIKKISAMNIEDISEFEWDELPLVPSPNELMSPFESCENLKYVKTCGPYDSVQEYMDIYFRLLRADCFSPLRTGIQNFLRNDLDPRDMNIYTEISLASVRITNRGSGFTLGLKVKPCTKIDDWKTCSNLQFGNLLCLSPSGSFKDPIWGTVTERDPKLLKAEKIIWVELCSFCNYKDEGSCITSLLEANGRTIMAESPAYYIAYQPVLQALQKSDPEKLAFQEELVHLQPPSPPKTLTLPSEVIQETMDKSQREAFVQALSQRIGIIQGPPGTGKTFIGISLIKHFIQQEENANFPILVLTYKNHALDEFMKAVLNFLPGEIARVGGRSQDPDIEKCTLQALKREHRRSHTNYEQKKEQLLEVAEVKVAVEQLIRKTQNAIQFSVESIIDVFDTLQIEKLLFASTLYDKASKKKTVLDQARVKDIWTKNKAILLRTDISAKEKISGLDGEVLSMIDQALAQWLPPKEAYKDIMKSEERLSELIALNAREELKEKPKEDPDALKDETDIEDTEKERLAAIWMPRSNQNTDVTVKFQDQQSNSKIPFIGPTAHRLAAQVPLLALKGIQELSSLSNFDKALIIQVVLWYQKEEVQKELKVMLEKYKQLLAAIKEIDDQYKVSVLQEKKVIGMTITGASIHHNLLRSLKPAIVLIEEAAEVLEPQLMAVLGDWVEHMILIGDHKQLRPSVENYLLARDYHLDVSMMERLINNNYPYATLKKQNRMLPEMAELLEDIYPELESNMERLGKKEPPDFIPLMYFWAHEEEETHDRSFSNKKEAERVVKLALLFLQQGYTAEDITVIAAYQGQVKLLRQMFAEALKDYPALYGYTPSVKTNAINQKQTEESPNNIKVHTIDMFQGDENKIVIVSLVRSNTSGQIGFLKTINRRCVAQSRAQCGMYFVGNIATLMKAKGSCWLKLILKMNQKKLVSMKIPFYCRYHGKASSVEALTARDIPLNGVCKLPCQTVMECGEHKCPKKCQPFHRHTKDQCNATVEFLHPKCKHPSKRKCYEPEDSMPCEEDCPEMMQCGKHTCSRNCQPEHSHLASFCDKTVEHKFTACGHVLRNKKCGEDVSTLRCAAKIPFKFKACNHFGTRKCWEEESQVICKELCTRKLSCDHPCEGYCGSACDASRCKVCQKKRDIEKKRQREAEERAREAERRKAKKELEEFNKKNPNPSQECHRHELHQQGDTASEFHDVRDRVQKYVQPGHNWFPNVTKIEKITNLKLQKAWLEAKTHMFDPTRSELKFHGTSDEGVEGISSQGFRLPEKGGMYGAGIYFATDSSKSAQKMYTKGSNKLLLCDVLIGKTLTVTTAMEKMNGQELKRKQYDSVFASRGTAVRYDEYIVYDPARALPKYIIHYNQCTFEEMRLSLGVPMGTELKHYTLTPKRQFVQSDPLDMHFRLAESQFLRLKARTGFNDNVTSVDMYVNPTLINQFSLKEKEFQTKHGKATPESKPILAFHGTRAENIEKIIKNNFDMSKFIRGSYGAGMYFSEFPDISIGYANGVNKLILCELLPGKSFPCQGPMQNAPLQPGYDSHIVAADAQGRGREVVIYDPNQVIPRYVINF